MKASVPEYKKAECGLCGYLVHGRGKNYYKCYAGDCPALKVSKKAAYERQMLGNNLQPPIIRSKMSFQEAAAEQRLQAQIKEKEAFADKQAERIEKLETAVKTLQGALRKIIAMGDDAIKIKEGFYTG